MNFNPSLVVPSDASYEPSKKSHLDPNFRYFGRKDKGDEFSEDVEYLKDLPLFWLERIRNIIAFPKRHCGTVNGIIVERYKYIALVFIENSIGELGVIYRRFVGKCYSKLQIGTRVRVNRCTVRNRTPRLIECAISSISEWYTPYTELDNFGWFTTYTDFQLYEVRIDRQKISVATEKYGRVHVPQNHQLFGFLSKRSLWTASTVIVCHIRYAVHIFPDTTTFFEFNGEFRVENPTFHKNSTLNSNREMLLTDYL